MRTIILIFHLAVSLVFYGCEQPSPISGSGSGSIESLWSFPKTTDNLEAVQPVIDNGRTYIAHDTNITCAELSTGKIIWQVAAGNRRSIASSKLLHEGNLLFLNHLEMVRAFDKSTGKVVWHTDIPNFDGRDLAVMAQNTSHLFLGGEGQVIRLNKSSGAVDMRIQLDQLAQAGTNQRALTLTVSPDGNYLYVPTRYVNSEAYGTQGNVFCYDVHTGNLVWGHHFTPKYIMRENNTDSVLVETHVDAVGITQGTVVVPLGMAIVGLDRATGKKIWEREINDDGFVGSIATDGNTAYIGSTGGVKSPRVYALDANTGATKWITATYGGSITYSIFAINGNNIAFCDIGRMFILDKQSGSIIWKGVPPEQTKGDNFAIYMSSPAYAEGYLVNVGSKKIYCLRAP